LGAWWVEKGSSKLVGALSFFPPNSPVALLKVLIARNNVGFREKKIENFSTSIQFSSVQFFTLNVKNSEKVGVFIGALCTKCLNTVLVQVPLLNDS